MAGAKLLMILSTFFYSFYGSFLLESYVYLKRTLTGDTAILSQYSCRSSVYSGLICMMELSYLRFKDIFCRFL